MSFYFYDYETFGISAKTSRIAQFAGIRTDKNLNIIDEKMLYCKPTNDSLPDPFACNITSISPQLCEQKGLIERNFIAEINTEFSQANTCIVGYNNIRFDDEFTRYTLYRNFFDPYAWAWKKGNFRWDLLDVVRMCYALKPETLNWVFDDNNIPSFKLDKLAPANNIIVKSHDALEDVRATIALAKIIKEKQPNLFSYALKLKDKKNVAKKIQLFQPMLHTSGMYLAKLGCTRRCVALGFSHFGNAIIFNLDQNPNILLELEVEELKKIQFAKISELPTGVERLQIKEMHFNKSPMFVPNMYKISPDTIKHLNIDMQKTSKHLQFILDNKQKISEKIIQLFSKTEFTANIDVDQALYDGFLSRNDRIQADKIISMSIENLANFQPNFENIELRKLFINFKARNYPELLNQSEKEYWFEVVQERIQTGKYGYLSIDKFEKALIELKINHLQKSKLWLDLEQYVQNII